jgi:hypothetical protein
MSTITFKFQEKEWCIDGPTITPDHVSDRSLSIVKQKPCSVSIVKA